MPSKATTLSSWVRREVTLTLNEDQLQELSSLVGASGLSEAVDAAITAHITRLHGLNEAQEWIDELKEDWAATHPGG